MKKEYAQYLINKTRDDYNLISGDFSRTRGRIWSETSFLFRSKNNDKVLDLGCGNGRYYELLKDTNYTGVDNSEELIKLAKKKYPKAKFSVADGLNLPFDNNTFDAIYSIAVLHRIPSYQFRLNFFKEAKRVLKKDGKLIITVWSLPFNGFNKKNIFLLLKHTFLKLIGLSKLDFGDVLEPWGNKTFKYYHWFSKRELVKLAEKSGFKVKESGFTKNDRGTRQNIYLVGRK